MARAANDAPTQRALNDTTAPAEGDGVETSPRVGDRIVKTTCYMCACRCGIDVHVREGTVRYINGNKDHPVNRGVICGKGSAGIMQHYSPARLRKPLLREGARGEGRFRAIEWDEALEIATRRLRGIRETDPKRLAFFTGRDQSQSLTGWWAQQFGTPNYAAHGGFCSVNMAAAGLYTIGGSFWEFGEPDWENTRYFLLFGVAEDHDSNPIKIGLGRLKKRGVKIVAVNPCRTGYNAVADDWIGIRPGTDGLLVLALVHVLLKAGKVDLDYLVDHTNAGALVIDEPDAPDHGLLLRDARGECLVWDRFANAPRPISDPDARPDLTRRQKADGRACVPVFRLIADRYLDPEYAPEAVESRCGVAAATIRRMAAELAEAAFSHVIELPVPWTDWAGRRHETMRGRPVAMHAMRGISAHANGFQTCRAIHLLQLLLGTVDVPGGFRFKPPYPKPAPPTAKPGGQGGAKPLTPLECGPLGFVSGPEDLLVDDAGAPLRIDKAFSWEAPLAIHGMMHTVIRNAWAGDPYPIDTLFLYMANMAWNSAMNASETLAMLTARDEAGEYRIPFVMYADAYASETVAYADLVLPDTTYFERHDCISLLDRPISHADGPGDAIRHPVVAPDRDVRPFQSVLIDLGARIGLPGFIDEDGGPKYRNYADYIVRHERRPGIGPLAGWRGTDGNASGKGAPNPEQLDRYIENGGFWHHEFASDERYFKMANRAYLETATRFGFLQAPERIIFQLYSEPLQRFRLAGQGKGQISAPPAEKSRLATYFDPLPAWYPALDPADEGEFPFHAVTQRPMHMYHSWGSQNAWLRQITSQNHLFMHRGRAEALGIEDDDWVWIESPTGRVKGQVRLVDGVNPDTVWTWNAVAKRKGTWGLKDDVPESERAFLLNHAIADLLPPDAAGRRYANADPITGQAAWFDLRVRIVKASAAEQGSSAPRFDPLPRLPLQPASAKKLAFGAAFRPGKAHTP